MKPDTSQTILIVNDNADQLNLMSILLKKAGYRILTANDGRAGIQVTLSQHPDLVISDVNMPHIDGIELCRRIRAEFDMRMLPILLVSAERKSSVNAIEGLQAGADDYLESPYDAERLIAKVARLLERKQGEEALRRSEARYRLIFASNPLPMWVYDLESLRFLDVNEAAVRQYGYSREEFLHMTIEEIRLPEEIASLHEALKMPSPGIDNAGIWKHRKRDGTIIDAEITSHIILFEEKRAEIVMANDVTERKRVEDAVRFQAHLLDTVEQAVIATDLSGIIVYWNRFAAELYGWSSGESLGRNIMELIPAESSKEQAVEIWSLLKDGQSWSGEFLARRRDGSLFPALITGSPVYDDKGVLVGIVGVSVDITERKRAEEKLKRSERQLAEAQQLTYIGSWEWDLTMNNVTWSDELYRIFGLEPQELVMSYEAYLERLHPEDRERANQFVEASLNSLEPFSYHSRAILPDGRVRILHVRGTINADEASRPVRMFGTVQDVTERRLAEEELKTSNEKLRALSVRLQSVREEESLRIAREIHDELGGALTGLKMDVSWFGKRLAESNREIMHQKLQSMSELIDDTIRKVRNISTELRPSVLDDLGLAAAIEWQSREFQKRTEIECRIMSLQEDIRLSTEKSTAVFRIFQEILTNVARHANANLVEIFMEEDRGNLILKVSDNGKGIKESDVSEMKSLGLLGMRERALVFGGKVDITGIEGKGTFVTVRIPLR
jgi:PAS domain S-box-containing protein